MVGGLEAEVATEAAHYQEKGRVAADVEDGHRKGCLGGWREEVGERRADGGRVELVVAGLRESRNFSYDLW